MVEQKIYILKGEVKMTSNWKQIGLWVSLFLEILFWFLYLSLLLTKISLPFAHMIWLLSGGFGIVFGALNINKLKNKVLPFVVFFMGGILIALWLLAMFITSM